MSKKKFRFQSWTMMKTNLKPLILFELWYKIMSVIGVGAIGALLFKLGLLASGIKYLGNGTMKPFLLNPVVWILLIIELLIIAFVTMVEMFGAVTAIYESGHGRKMTVSQILMTGVSKARRSFKQKSIGFYIFILLILPLSQLLPLAGVITSISLPGFVVDSIQQNRMQSILVLAILALITIFVLRRLFLIHAYTLQGGSYKEAKRTARTLMKGAFWSTLLKLILKFVIHGIVILVIGFVIVLLALLLIWLFVSPLHRHDVALTVVNGIVIGISGIYGLMAPFITFAFLGSLYEERCEKTGILPAEKVESYKGFQIKASRILYLITAILVLGTIVSEIVDPGVYTSLDNAKVVVAAHRGSSVNCPENSIPAFLQAIEEGAEWIELDVHQTKDGVVVVTHDADIKRIAGVDKNVYDLTYEELETYDVGSWFSPEFSDLRVATLDEVLKLCKGKVKIQIELKPTGHEPDFEEHVIQIVRDNEFENDCLLGSLKADCIKRCKELAPDIQTLFIMHVATGDVQKIEFADTFSVEENNADPHMIEKIHNQSKRCFVWTVNREEDVYPLLQTGVDGFVTDDPVMVQKALARGGKNPIVVSIIDWIYGEDTYQPLYEKLADRNY